MKNKFLIPFFLLLAIFGGCKKWLDINTDPDTTQEPSNGAVLPQILASIPTALQSDGGLYIAKYVQNWLTHTASNANTYDNLGYSWSGGTMAASWSMIFYAHGANLQYLLENAEHKNQNDFIGVGLAIKAWDYQHGTDYFSDLPFYDAMKAETYVFRYDTPETIYRVVDSLCRRSLSFLNLAVGNPANTVAKGDMVYNGDILKWKRFVYGVLARNYNHVSNKASYKADSVMKFCDSSLLAATDDFCVPFDATFNDNSNYFGTYRDNMTAMRQSNFITHLLDGTILTGDTASLKSDRDPRIAHMLVCSSDTANGNGGYRGVDPGSGDPYSALNPPSSYLVSGQPPTSSSALTNYLNARKKVAIPFGDSIYLNPSAGAFGNQGKFLFKNKAVFPVMTAAEIQFIKAEAAFRKGDLVTAYSSYKKGIQLHFDFINRDYSGIRSSSPIYNTSPIPVSSISAYMNSRNVKQKAEDLTMSDIMLQKYIALWGWGFFETWADFRRFDCYNPAAVDSFSVFQSVYKGFTLPQSNASYNQGKYPQKIRPHYTSENTYNLGELQRLGELKNNWQVEAPIWFAQP